MNGDESKWKRKNEREKKYSNGSFSFVAKYYIRILSVVCVWRGVHNSI